MTDLKQSIGDMKKLSRTKVVENLCLLDQYELSLALMELKRALQCDQDRLAAYEILAAAVKDEVARNKLFLSQIDQEGTLLDFLQLSCSCQASEILYGRFEQEDSKSFSKFQEICKALYRLYEMNQTIKHTLELPLSGQYAHVRIKIHEDRSYGSQPTCKGDGTLKTGGVVWDAAYCLVDLISQLGMESFRGRRVLELGAGCGFVGLAAASLGAIVTLTDRSDHLENLSKNADLNTSMENVVDVAALDWDDREAARRFSEPFDWILASDVVYEQDSHSSLRDLLHSLVGHETIVLISYESRTEKHDAFFTSLERDPAFHVRQMNKSCFSRPRWTEETQDLRIYAIAPASLTCASSHQMSLKTLQHWRDELHGGHERARKNSSEADDDVNFQEPA
mmetsp:Transcript_41824/g.131888  ORF Transcript_41824/g.131888 Transcript_41824/m.131888 type:complete len:394 (+) Transcript_41824:98-1279(+)